MRVKILALMLACLSIAASAKAQDSEFGPQFAIPLPAVDVGDTELGISAGMTATGMQYTTFGVGLDLVYHYWPAAPGFKADYAALLKREFYLVINEPTWVFSALQATAHLKVVAPLSGRFAPWLTFGAGGYRVNRNLEGLWPGMAKVSIEPGYFGSMGVDYKGCASMKIGLDASYHHLWTARDFGSDFVAVEMGAHVLFGRQRPIDDRRRSRRRPMSLP